METPVPARVHMLIMGACSQVDVVVRKRAVRQLTVDKRRLRRPVDNNNSSFLLSAEEKAHSRLSTANCQLSTSFFRSQFFLCSKKPLHEPLLVSLTNAHLFVADLEAVL